MVFLSYLNKKCVPFLALVAACNIQAYIIKITHMYNPAKDQHVFLCGDRHEDKDFGNQRQDFFDAVKTLGAKVIVEDKSVWACHSFNYFKYMLGDFLQDPVGFDYNKLYLDSDSLNDLEKVSWEGFLIFLTQGCLLRSISVHNVEFRAVKNYSHELGIGAKNILRVLQNIVNEINQYNDGYIFNNYYKVLSKMYEYLFKQSWFKTVYDTDHCLPGLAAVEPCLCRDFLKQLPSLFQNPFYAINATDVYCKHKKLQALLVNLIKQMRLEGSRRPLLDCLLDEEIPERMKKYNVFEEFLLDARILHQIHIAPHGQTLFVCAGAWHTDNVINVLQAADYIVVDSCPTSQQLGQTNPDLDVVNIKEYMEHTPMYHVDHACSQYLQLLDNAPLSELCPIKEYIKTTIDKDPSSALCLLKKMVEKQGVWDFALDIIHGYAASKHYLMDPMPVLLTKRIVEIILEKLCGPDLEDIVRGANAYEMLDTQQRYTVDDLVNEIIKGKARNDSAFLSWISHFISALKFNGHP